MEHFTMPHTGTTAMYLGSPEAAVMLERRLRRDAPQIQLIKPQVWQEALAWYVTSYPNRIWCDRRAQGAPIMEAVRHLRDIGAPVEWVESIESIESIDNASALERDPAITHA